MLVGIEKVFQELETIRDECLENLAELQRKLAESSPLMVLHTLIYDLDTLCLDTHTVLLLNLILRLPKSKNDLMSARNMLVNELMEDTDYEHSSTCEGLNIEGRMRFKAKQRVVRILDKLCNRHLTSHSSGV